METLPSSCDEYLGASTVWGLQDLPRPLTGFIYLSALSVMIYLKLSA